MWDMKLKERHWGGRLANPSPFAKPKESVAARRASEIRAIPYQDSCNGGGWDSPTARSESVIPI